MFKILYELLIFIIITAGSSGLTLITSVGTAIEAAESEVGTVSVRLTRGPAGVHRPRAGGRGQRRHRGTRPGASSVNTGVSEESFILLVEGCGLSTVNVEPRRECEFHCVGVPSDCPQEECSNFNKIVDNSGIEDDGSRHSSISTRRTALTGQMGQTEETIFPFQTSTSHGLAST